MTGLHSAIICTFFLMTISKLGLARQCRPGYVNCGENICIGKNLVCDKSPDCFDNSDEKNCTYDSCTVDNHFKCSDDRQCVIEAFRCDGEKNCDDGSDEIGCQRLECIGFRCKDNSQCLTDFSECDGTKDCADGSDEHSSCPKQNTTWNQVDCSMGFPCGDGACLMDGTRICDGHSDCETGRDERPEICSLSMKAEDCKQTYLMDHHKGIICTCRQGFRLSNDSKTCEDIDECSLDYCSQDCENTNGSFTCSCSTGFTLVNGTFCKSLTTPIMHFHQRYTFGNQSNNKTTLKIDDELKLVLLKSLGLFYYVPEEGYMYGTRGFQITKMPMLEKGEEQLVFNMSALVHGLTVDPNNRNVYLSTDRKMFICDQMKRACSPFALGRHDYGLLQLFIDVHASRIYWNDNFRVFGSALDGNEMSPIFESKRNEYITAYTVDTFANKLFVAIYKKLIYSINLSTGAVRTLVTLNERVFRLQVFEDTLYVQYAERGNVSPIMRFNKLTGHHLGYEEVAKGMVLRGIYTLLPNGPSNKCWDSPCSHICVPSKLKRYTCLCPSGFSLQDDRKTCKIDQDKTSLLIASGGPVYRVYADDILGPTIELVDFELHKVSAMAYDSEGGVIFVAENENLMSVYLSNSSRVLISEKYNTIKAMSFDPVDRMLYFADVTSIVAFDTKSKNFILIEEKFSVSQLVVDYMRRQIYVAHFNGIISKMAIGSSRWQEQARGRHKRIYMGPQGGLQIKPEGELPQLEDINCTLREPWKSGENIMSCVIYGTYMDTENQPFWNQKLDLSHKPVFLQISPTRRAAPKNKCSLKSSDCQICVTGPEDKAYCMCPFGHTLGADGKTCSEGCEPGQLQCPDKKCILKRWRCDGKKDCIDGSDEQHCDDHVCGENSSKCNDGACIDKKFVCDSQFDCADNSDELNCPAKNCTAMQFSCEGSACIPLSQRCDGASQCPHGDDERDCPKKVCDTHSKFTCDNGSCISKEWVCDDREDCSNGEDETGCELTMSNARAVVMSELGMSNETPESFTCDNGGTISRQLHCDGNRDCDDGSDEIGCPNMTCKGFTCKDKSCISEEYVCDGITHCTGGEDEASCKGKCRHLFECRSGHCVPHSWTCNGRRDCSDGSDELLSSCSTNTSTTTAEPKEEDCYSDQFHCGSGECIADHETCDGHVHCRDGSDEGGHCPRNECDIENGGCAHICHPTAEGPKCSCRHGYLLGKDGMACQDIDECQDPAMCSHFCTNLKGGHGCSCAHGYTLSGNGECKANRGQLAFIVLEHNQLREVTGHNTTVIYDGKNDEIDSFDYNFMSGFVFLTHSKLHVIRKVSLTNSSDITTMNLILNPKAIAVDWLTGLVYFFDGFGHIQACEGNLGRHNCTTVIDTEMKEITSLVVLAHEGTMFWTGFGPIRGSNSSKLAGGKWSIEKADMDGGDRHVIVSEGLSRPISLTVDLVLRRIYWLDEELGLVDTVRFDGTGRINVLKHLAYVYGIALFEDSIFYADQAHNSWIQAHRVTGKHKSIMNSGLGRSTLVKVKHGYLQPGERNHCDRANCTQMCLQKPQGFKCACVYGFSIHGNSSICTKTDSLRIDEKTDTEMCTPPCQNGGICYVRIIATHCRCLSGFSGAACELKDDTVSWSVLKWLGGTFGCGLVLCFILALLSMTRDTPNRFVPDVTVNYINPVYQMLTKQKAAYEKMDDIEDQEIPPQELHTALHPRRQSLADDNVPTANLI